MKKSNWILTILSVGIVATWTAAASDDTANAPKGDAKVYTRPSDNELKTKLTPLQYKVTQQESTERPFTNEFHDNKTPGLYVDIVSGEPLFASVHKFDSGSGWPSFWEVVEPGNIVEKVDKSIWATRTEVRSKHGDSHLGHVFNDGPQPTGLRYCINSASLRFVPVDKLAAEGYDAYAKLFESPDKK